MSTETSKAAAVDVVSVMGKHARAATLAFGPDNEDTEARNAVVDLFAAVNAALNQDQVELPGWLTEQLSTALANCGVQP